MTRVSNHRLHHLHGKLLPKLQNLTLKEVYSMHMMWQTYLLRLIRQNKQSQAQLHAKIIDGEWIGAQVIILDNMSTQNPVIQVLYNQVGIIVGHSNECYYIYLLQESRNLFATQQSTNSSLETNTVNQSLISFERVSLKSVIKLRKEYCNLAIPMPTYSSLMTTKQTVHRLTLEESLQSQQNKNDTIDNDQEEEEEEEEDLKNIEAMELLSDDDNDDEDQHREDNEGEDESAAVGSSRKPTTETKNTQQKNSISRSKPSSSSYSSSSSSHKETNIERESQEFFIVIYGDSFRTKKNHPNYLKS
jgi:hypothetical protein